MSSDTLEVGAVYRDPGREGAPAVDFIVGRFEQETTIEGEPVLEIAHVQIGPADGGDGVIMSHAPVERAAVAAAAAQKVGEADVGEPFEEGLAAWREAFEAGEAGVFSIGPAEIYASVMEMMRQRGGGDG